MTNIQVAQAVAAVLAGITGILAAWFKLRDYWQSVEERAKTRELYARRWQGIERRRLLELPVPVVEWFFEFKMKSGRLLLRFFDAAFTPGWGGALVTALTLVAFTIGALQIMRSVMRSVSPLLVLMGLLFVLSVIVAFAFAIQKDTASRKVVRRLSSIAMGGLFLVVMNGSLILVGTAPIQTVTVVALVAMPVYLLALGL